MPQGRIIVIKGRRHIGDVWHVRGGRAGLVTKTRGTAGDGHEENKDQGVDDDVEFTLFHVRSSCYLKLWGGGRLSEWRPSNERGVISYLGYG